LELFTLATTGHPYFDPENDQPMLIAKPSRIETLSPEPRPLPGPQKPHFCWLGKFKLIYEPKSCLSADGLSVLWVCPPRPSALDFHWLLLLLLVLLRLETVVVPLLHKRVVLEQRNAVKLPWIDTHTRCL